MKNEPDIVKQLRSEEENGVLKTNLILDEESYECEVEEDINDFDETQKTLHIFKFIDIIYFYMPWK